jgi:predicted NBD/HSP70 family sugar kinase
MKIINYYLNNDIIVSTGKGISTEEGGKKPTLYQFNATGGYVVAFHIFPDELFAVITDLKVNIFKEKSISFIENEKLPIVIELIKQAYVSLIEDTGINKNKIIGLAIGAHGITNFQEGLVIHAPHFSSWGGEVTLKDLLLEKLTFEKPVIIDNQIRFQAFAEKIKGLAKNKKNIIVVEGGAGLVAGIIVKYEIKRGVHFLAGEIGHIIINPFTDEICACGGKGCFETMVSTKRILKLTKEKQNDCPDSSIRKGIKNRTITVWEIFDASNKGDSLACAVMDDIAQWFAIGLSNLVLAYDPEMIILQGIYTKAGNFLLNKIKEKVNEVSLIHIKKNVKIEYSKFGKEAGVVGTAAYVVSDYFNDSIWPN